MYSNYFTKNIYLNNSYIYDDYKVVVKHRYSHFISMIIVRKKLHLHLLYFIVKC